MSSKNLKFKYDILIFFKEKLIYMAQQFIYRLFYNYKHVGKQSENFFVFIFKFS